jgi:Na+-translocating ferredoxin:NAD+ oxidoreductase RnfG subunit
MARAQRYRCPVCNKALTKKEFERAFNIHEGQKQHLEALQQQLAEVKRKSKQNENQIRKDARSEARQAEKDRTSRILEGKDKALAKVRKAYELLKRGKTPQEGGPEFEVKLVKRLRAEFKDDDVQPTKGGRSGDVLHTVKEAGKIAGVIIYECKWEPRISGSHVRQAAQAKMSRRAHFAVLVTTGTKRGFSGLTEVSGVLVVAPAGTVALAALLRNHLIGMLRAGIEKKRRAKVANQLLKFIKSPEFRNPIEEVVRTAEQLKDGVEDEYKWHVNDWKKRLSAYERIRWDGFAVQENLRRVFHGEAPKQLLPPKVTLALPAPGQR